MESVREERPAVPRQEIPYEEEIDLRDLLLVLYRYRKVVIAIFLFAVAVGAVVSFLLPPTYEVKALVSLGSIPTSSGQTVSIMPPAAAKEMLLSRDLFQEAVKNAGLDLRNPLVNSCKKGLKAEVVKDTNFIRITIETSDPVLGKKILDELVDVFKQKAASGFNRQMELTRNELKRVSAELVEVDKNIEKTKDALGEIEKTAGGVAMEWELSRLLESLSRFQEQRAKLLDKKFSLEQALNTSRGIEVVEAPTIPEMPVRPRKTLNIAVSGVLGLMVGFFAAFALNYFRHNPLNFENMEEETPGSL